MTRALIAPSSMQRMREIAAATPPGALVEVGVYQGGSAAVLYELAREQGRTLYLFDTFCGMPFAGPLDGHRVGDFADTSVEQVRALCPHAEIVPGVFPASIVDTGPVAFVHADADQYQSTVDICQSFGPRMVPGGAMLFDDYPALESCRVAVRECFPDHDILPDGRAVVRF